MLGSAEGESNEDHQQWFREEGVFRVDTLALSQPIGPVSTTEEENRGEIFRMAGDSG